MSKTDGQEAMTEVRKEHQFNVESFQNYLSKNLQGFKGPIVSIKQFKSGQSNPTFYFKDSNGTEYVMRKKPHGKLLKSAHMIEREYEVMNALQKINFPVAKTFLYCTDESVIGTHFYIMEFVRGRIFRDIKLPGVSPKERRDIYDEMNRVMAMLHTVDYAAIGLSNYGKAGNYYERQVSVWTRQYEDSKTSDIPSVNKLIEWLPKNIPRENSNLVSIAHGDFRLENVIFHPTEPRILAVLDWELSTLGHPFADLAYFCMIYHSDIQGLGDARDKLTELGFPTEEEFIKAYCKRTGRRNISSWDFYIVFSIFRLLAIAQGVYKRAIQGNASAPNALSYGPIVQYLADIAWKIAELSKYKKSLQMVKLNHEIFSKSASRKFDDYYVKLLKFMDDYIYPNEELYEAQLQKDPWKVPPILTELQQKAKEQGLWNLFLPDEKYGAGLTNLEYSPMAEIMGRSVAFAPSVFNCNAPDTGNMEVLWKYGNEQQKKQWLEPLLNGDIRSCFAMTEPDVASSDATNIQCNIVREGNNYVINGRKWWITNANHPQCKIIILMGKTDPKNSDRHKQQSMILVPMDAPGVKVVRALTTFGYYDEPGGHCELSFENVRVPVSNIILGEGKGFEIAQGRLGPGRIHHCMRAIGMAERALDIMCQRVKERTAFGKLLAAQGKIQSDISKSRMELDQSRLLTLKTAHMMDVVGNKTARTEIAMIKVVVPNMALKVVDRAIQAHGGAGVLGDGYLARCWAFARTLRIADGPDEVHKRTVALLELAKKPQSKL